jgi:hypothetical protein
VRTSHFLRDLRAADIVMALTWLDDERPSLKFGAERLFALMDGTVIENQLIERSPECLLMPSTKVQKSMRKCARAEGRSGELSRYTWRMMPSEYHLGDELSDK